MKRGIKEGKLSSETTKLISMIGVLFLFGCGNSKAPNIDPEIGNQEYSPRVIYGPDDRLDYYQVPSDSLRTLADSTVALFEAQNLVVSGNQVSIKSQNFGTAENLCSDEPFRDQILGAFCSGSLVAPDIIITAGHCITNQTDCAKTRFVFGFAVKTPGVMPTNLPTSEIYSCSQVLHTQAPGAGADFSVIRLDRPVPNHTPLQIRRQGSIAAGEAITVIGHPVGLPTKIAGGANVRRVDPNGFFVANLDTYGGNSGSAVFNNSTGVIEGILVRGENDFVMRGNCQVSNRCAGDGCRGEDVTLISQVIPFLPVGPAPTPTPTPIPTPTPTPPVTVPFEVSAKPNQTIPDNNKTGITSQIEVSQGALGRKVQIRIDVAHTYRGDLVIQLISPSGVTKTLQSKSGGSADNVVGIFGDTLPSVDKLDDLSNVAAGKWNLKVMDTAAKDIGTLKSWSVIFK